MKKILIVLAILAFVPSVYARDWNDKSGTGTGTATTPAGDTNTIQMNLAGSFGGSSIYQSNGNNLIWIESQNGVTQFYVDVTGTSVSQLGLENIQNTAVQGRLYFFEAQDNGGSWIGMQAPASMAGNPYWITLPQAAGVSDQVLATDSTGILTFSDGNDFDEIYLNGVLLGDASGVYLGSVKGDLLGINMSQSGISPYYQPVSGITLDGTNLNTMMVIEADTYIGLPTADNSGVSTWFVKFIMGAGNAKLTVGTYSVGSSEVVQGTAGGTWVTGLTGFQIPALNPGASVLVSSYDSGSSVYVYIDGTSAVSMFK